jgi:peptidoglycan/xylan/chitin deacetylase (PgdA/CDA1 family)
VATRLAQAGFAFAGVAWAAPALAPVVPPIARPLGIALTGDAGDGVALTFDDGPHPDGTPAVLQALEDAGAVATFFLVGEQIERRPSLAAEIAARGHSVQLHGYRHRNLLRIPPRVLARDLDRGAELVAEVSGAAPRLHRAPLGIYSAGALAQVRRRRWTPTLWSRWGRDWRRSASVAGIAADATRQLGAGDVVLLHDADYYSAPGSWRRTVAALPLILAEVEARGLHTVTL